MLFWFDSVLGRPSQSQRSIYFLIEDRVSALRWENLCSYWLRNANTVPYVAFFGSAIRLSRVAGSQHLKHLGWQRHFENSRTGLIELVISEGDGPCPALKFQKEKENRWAIVAEEKEITWRPPLDYEAATFLICWLLIAHFSRCSLLRVNNRSAAETKNDLGSATLQIDKHEKQIKLYTVAFLHLLSYNSQQGLLNILIRVSQ